MTRTMTSATRHGERRVRALATDEASTSEDVRYHAWRGHRVAYRSSGTSGPAIVLVHGFGVSSYQFRDNIEALGERNRVFAIDLVGFGASDQPDVAYNMEFWRDQVIDFVENVVGEPAVLVGNSIGSLAAVHVASASPKSTSGIVLINCAGGMNNKVKRLDGDFDGYGLQYKAVVPIFSVVLAIIDTVLKIEPIAKPLFNSVRGEENVRGALANVYMDASRVDDGLVKSICGAANREGAFKAFVNILTGPAGPRPEELMPNVECPILILWGSKDTITPLDFPLGQYFFNLEKTRVGKKTDFVQFDGEGHCVQDDNPKLVNEAIGTWVAGLP
ncbi:Alpha/beta hydrolase fold-1 [Ostreococcus tauri]|uniref:Alpha/beta hydrolase fold-1 n=1 Tax=Ostreococcus tauri TaxID=70448 RepID=A0A090M6R5_OSTTA|nr:Alpha/beta hydrolase fold-1 [Ostreococcus tauri]CEF99871.1 Alpha/beta hydrolase fold-1 [Ostreococcus tauri]|eukprot:XP_022840086.1 Alpha/beta hydrolase fold-1 [Ostreococcus tauri]